MREKCSLFENKLNNKLKESQFIFKENKDLYYAYTYFVEGRKADASENANMVKRMAKQLNNMDFSILRDLEIEELAEYAEALRKQLDMANTIWKYKKISKN